MISYDIVRKLKELTNNRVFLAKELLSYSPELEPAINNIFGGIMVALDEETAKKVAFYNDYGRFNCVTIKGDKYNSAGTLEGGFKKSNPILVSV
jgi:chromosome segregation ATPase